MTNEKKPKWDIGAAITAGSKAFSLATTYKADIEDRLQPGELAQLKSDTLELELHRSGQVEKLTQQKSKTLSQDEVIGKLYDSIMSLRNIVKHSSSVTPDILKAFGVGERLTRSISDITAGANLIISAFNANTDWATSVGIIELDITEISDLLTKLSKAEEEQDNAMFIRKSKTMSKNVLQRTVEDEVSKISAIGQHVFHSRDAAIAKLFEELLPSSPKAKNGTEPEVKAEPEEVSNP